MKTLTSTLIYLTGAAILLLAAGNGLASEGDLNNMGNGICLDRGTKLMWEIDKSKRYSDIAAVNAYVSNLKLGGYSDWRLPTTSESIELRGLIAIQGNDDCNIPRLDSKYWLVDEKKGTVPARLELECFCRGDFNLIVKDKGYARLVRDSKPVN